MIKVLQVVGLCSMHCSFIYVLLLRQMWSIKPGWGSRPDIYVDKGHADDITGLKFSVDGLLLLSRSLDGTLKVVWFPFL